MRNHIFTLLTAAMLLMSGAVFAQQPTTTDTSQDNQGAEMNEGATVNDQDTMAQDQGTQGTRTTQTQGTDTDYDQYNQNQYDDQLPQTASPLPLLALIGLASLGGSLALRRSRQS